MNPGLWAPNSVPLLPETLPPGGHRRQEQLGAFSGDSHARVAHPREAVLPGRPLPKAQPGARGLSPHCVLSTDDGPVISPSPQLCKVGAVAPPCKAG